MPKVLNSKIQGNPTISLSIQGKRTQKIQQMNNFSMSFIRVRISRQSKHSRVYLLPKDRYYAN